MKHDKLLKYLREEKASEKGKTWDEGIEIEYRGMPIFSEEYQPTESDMANAVTAEIKERFPELFEHIRKTYPAQDMPGAIGVFALRRIKNGK